MIFTFALLIAATAALYGWGYGTIWVLSLVGLKSPHRFDIVEAIIGLAVVTTFINIENIWMPLGYLCAIVLLVFGWVLFLLSLPRVLPIRSNLLWVGLGIVWLASVSTQAVIQPWNYDSGLYHIPTIRWLLDAPTPFGLVNLYWPFAINSTWFSISAWMSEITAPYAANYTALASETLFGIFGLSILAGLEKFVSTKANNLSVIFLVLCSAIGFAPVVMQNLSSPSPDHPMLILTVLLGFVFLRAVTAQDEGAFYYELWLGLILALLVISIKVSLAPLLLLPIALGVVGHRRHRGIFGWRNLVVAAGTVVLIWLPWLVRGLLLSGCFVFPITATCVWGLPWAANRSEVEAAIRWTDSWGRAPGKLPDQVLGNWDWFGPWLTDLVHSTDFILPAVFFGVGVVAFVLIRSRVRAPVLPVIMLLVISFIGILTWLWLAPDIRHAVGWFWLAAIGMRSISVSVLVERPAFVPVVRLAGIVLVLAMLISVAAFGINYALRSGETLDSALVAIPPMPQAAVIMRQSLGGVPINVIDAGARCFWISVCTSMLEPNLTATQSPDNRIYFYPMR